MARICCGRFPLEVYWANSEIGEFSKSPIYSYIWEISEFVRTTITFCLHNGNGFSKLLHRPTSADFLKFQGPVSKFKLSYN
jgi:hypothetical protein